MATAILVVEDDADINNLLCTILRKQRLRGAGSTFEHRSTHEAGGDRL